MRAWENRSDTVVVDEPLYAHYLHQTGLDHPGRVEILDAGPIDWHEAVAQLNADGGGPHTIQYQKHMAHHLLPSMDRAWLRPLTHCFLIREPREMLTSLLAVWPQAVLADTGLPQQVALVAELEASNGSTHRSLTPETYWKTLSGCCERCAMHSTCRSSKPCLQWPPGPRDSDGVWAKHWYANVNESTTFAPYRPKKVTVPEHKRDVLKSCQTLYDSLHAKRIVL